jgi:hypothetical protein
MKLEELKTLTSMPNTRGELLVEVPISGQRIQKATKKITFPFERNDKRNYFMAYSGNLHLDYSQWANKASVFCVEQSVLFARIIKPSAVTLLWRHTIINP